MVVGVANGGLVCKTPVLTSGGPGSETPQSVPDEP